MAGRRDPTTAGRIDGEQDSEFAFMINAGVGLDYRFDDDITIGTSLIYNIMPGGSVSTLSTWQLITVTFMW